MYAIIETGGKQYKVTEGQVIQIEKVDIEPGQVLEIDRVLAVGGAGDFRIGTPLVEGAKVVLKVLSQDKAKKIIVFKYKAKKNYRRKKGHRQPITKALVEKIVV